jgi:uncharacterized membrane protein YraQ (UPF0718 family)
LDTGSFFKLTYEDLNKLGGFMISLLEVIASTLVTLSVGVGVLIIVLAPVSAILGGLWVLVSALAESYLRNFLKKFADLENNSNLSPETSAFFSDQKAKFEEFRDRSLNSFRNNSNQLG